VAEPILGPPIPVKADFERVGGHEAGHAVVGLSLGLKLDKIEYVTNGLPGSLQAFEVGVATKFTSSFHKLEPRLQYLQVAGGMAGETLILGKYDPQGAADDIHNLQSVGLTETQIAGLVGVAQKILEENLAFFDRLRSSIASRLESPDAILLAGAAINVRFAKTGTKVDVWTDVLKLLPD
jgi:hypothetical protein